MKKIPLFSAIIALICAIVLTGTVAVASEEKKDIENVQLSEEGVLTWDAYEGATRYWIVFGPVSFEPEENSADLYQRAFNSNLASGTYSISLVACDDNWKELSNHYYGSFEFTAPVGLPKVENLRWEGRVARWDPVDGAIGYSVYLMAGDSTIEIYYVDNDTMLDLSDSLRLYAGSQYCFKVMAVAEEGSPNGEMSDKSGEVEGWFVKYEIQNVSISEYGILTWDPYEGATRYWLRYGDGACEPDEMKVNLNELFAGGGRESGEYNIDLVACNDNWGELSLHYEGKFNYEKHFLVIYELPNGDLFTKQAVKSGSKAVRPSDPEDNELVFSGWLLNGEPYDFDSAVTDDLTIIASFVEAPATDVPATDEPATDVPATDVPATDEPATDIPATDVPATDTPTELPATDAPATAAPSTDAPIKNSSNNGSKMALIIVSVLLGLAVAAGAVFAVLAFKKKGK